MGSKFRRNSPSRQAFLKIEGQKLLKMDDSGGFLSNLGGLPVLAKIAQDTGLIQMAAECIEEWRDPDRLELPLIELLSQRTFLAACGLPDAIDCSFWRDDPALKAVLGKDLEAPSLGSQSTHTRMEQGISDDTVKKLEALPLDFFFKRHKHAPRALTIFIDGTAIRTFGAQQNSMWRGGRKYSQTQYFPLIATTDGGDLLLAQLRSGVDADARSVATVSKLLLDIKAQWKDIKLTVVMDTGFNCPELLDLLEAENISYAIGYPSTTSVQSKMKDLCKSAEREFRQLHGEPRYMGSDGSELWQQEHERIRGLPAEKRMLAEKEMNKRHVRWVYQTPHNGVNWDCDRAVIHRVDFTDRGVDMRCVVTNIQDGLAEAVYDQQYCRRARVEMFIKEHKSHCKVPLSCQEFTANQFRFALQSLAYILLHMLRLELPVREQNISLLSVRKLLLQIPVHLTSSSRRLSWALSTVHPTSRTLITMARKLHARTA
jgi:hypothetical protein